MTLSTPARFTRRALFRILGAVSAACTVNSRALAEDLARPIPQRPAARVIVDNDLSGDPDGLAALAHQLLTPKTRTMLVTTTALDVRGGDRRGFASRELALELLRRLGVKDAPPVYKVMALAL